MDGVQGSALLCEEVRLQGCSGREAGGVGAVGSEAHEAVEERPGGTEDVGGSGGY